MRISDWSSDVCSSDLCDGGTALFISAKRAQAVRPSFELRRFLTRSRTEVDSQSADQPVLVDREMIDGQQAIGIRPALRPHGQLHETLVSAIDEDRKSTRLNSSH